MAFSISVTYVTSPNIAIIKYWGKEDEENIIPLNSSISFALSSNVINSKTTVSISEEFKNDELYINEQLVNINDNKRMVKLLNIFRSICKDVKNDKDEVIYPSSKLKELYVRIKSINNFPTAAGLASSASGLSCLCLCLSKIYQLKYSMIELSKICRLGSGSACRSLYGGFVEWVKDGKESYSIQLYPNSHWNSIRSVIVILNENSKKVPSSIAMKRSKETSELLKYRCEYVVPKRIEELKNALKNKDFGKLCEIMMKDSNEFHSICLDTFPPVHYLSEDSYKVIDIIHLLNDKMNKTVFGYTFDAGPNPVLLCEVDNLNMLMGCINFVNKNCDEEKLPNDGYQTALNEYKSMIDIKRVIVSDIGEDPQLIEKKLEF